MKASDGAARVADATPEIPASRGRRRNHSRDAEILEAALDVLADYGASNMTMDLVAERAGAGKATIYRRWTSKTALVIEAVAHMKRNQVDLKHLPDTGTLRGDLLALFKPQAIDESTRKLKIMSGLASLLADNRELAEAASSALAKPWADAHLALMRRAVHRHEIDAAADIGTVSQVIPVMAAYRALIERKSFSLEFLTGLVDGVVLPALRRTTTTPASDVTSRKLRDI